MRPTTRSSKVSIVPFRSPICHKSVTPPLQSRFDAWVHCVITVRSLLFATNPVRVSDHRESQNYLAVELVRNRHDRDCVHVSRGPRIRLDRTFRSRPQRRGTIFPNMRHNARPV